MRDHVARVRRLLDEATTARPALDLPAPVSIDATNIGDLPTLEQSPRARSEREILRIAAWYNWGAEITRFLDAYQVVSLCGLPAEGLERLLDRMNRLEDCVREGLDPPDAPPAR